MIVLVVLLPCFHDFSHGASVHPYSSMNDFCTCNIHKLGKVIIIT